MTGHDIALHRSASLSIGSFDADARTVEATISTFADVTRRDARGAYVERLDPAGLDLSNLTGVPLLDGHRQGSARDVIGVLETHRMESGQLVATFRLSGAADAAPIIERISEGTLRGVSVGYRVTRWQESRDGQGQRVRTAVAWQIHEASAVAIAADPGATFRSGTPMPLDNENDRAELIQRIRSAHALPEDWATRMTEAADELTDDEIRQSGRDEALTRRRSLPQIRVGHSSDDPAALRTRQADALAFRMAGGELPEASRDFVGLSLKEMAADALARSGVSVRGLSTDELFQRAAHGTSDFPLVVSNAMGKVAAEAYRAAESPLKALARQRTLPNFKESTSIRLGEMGRLEEMTEQGEFKATSRAENGETLHLRTFGRKINVSRKLMIDDDLNLLGDMTAAMGQAAAQTEADELVSLLTANPDLSDGTPVFDASRGNLGTVDFNQAGLFDEVASARAHMRTVKGLDGKTIIDAAPKYLIVSPAMETDAERFLSAIYAPKTDDANPFAGKLELVIEPRLTGAGWFLMADPARLASLQYAYLAAAPGVQIQRMESWETLGMSFRAFLDFGCGWLDWRGAYYSAA
ncbi:Mu-like prophage major head subunit gpT family protein [Rhodovulum steppense]|uniref:HK97 family phage prohead protease n=1 Tax=Rhodovulum steppense TaxID=540251 RepID=A0A4R1YVL4_9RHOB|nr:Mu-like prophage major head subunit gpT family protein [Rhodovulum steppense]TCM85171.1 HK97 family phage prohead protease [Rhodovulum steppense]